MHGAAGLTAQRCQPFSPLGDFGVVHVMESKERYRQRHNEWQEADAYISHAPTVSINQLLGDQLGDGPANAGAHECNPQSKTAFLVEPARDGLGEGDGQGACAER